MFNKLSAERRSKVKWFLLSSFGCSAAFGLLVGTVGYFLYQGQLTFIQSNFRSISMIYLFMGAPFTIAGLLFLFTNIENSWCTVYGFMLYYGTYILKYPLARVINIGDLLCFVVSFLIMLALTTLFYIIHLRRNNYPPA